MSQTPSPGGTDASVGASAERTQKPENPLLNLGFNILLPALLLIKGKAWLGLTPGQALVVALVFPLGYGLYDLVRRRKWNVFSIVGLVSVLLTGGIGLLHLPAEYVAIKEALVPLALGLVVLASAASRQPLVRPLFFNDAMVDVPRIEAALVERSATEAFERLVRRATVLMASSLFLSAILNFVLARWIVTAEAGTAEFNEQLGRMALWSYPVIVLPCMLVTAGALYYLVSGAQRVTGLTLEQIFREQKR